MKKTLTLAALLMCITGTAFAGDKMTSDKMESDKMMAAPAMEKKDSIEKHDAMMMAPAIKKDQKAMDGTDKIKGKKDKM